MVDKSYGENILWMDVETTGLDAEKEQLLQVAALIGDAQGNILSREHFEAVIHHGDAHELKARAIPYVQEMHSATGLWERLATGTPLEQVDAALLDYMKEYSPEPGSLRMGGNSLRLDLNFTEKFLPLSYGHISFRSVDVTALRYAAENWGVTKGKTPFTKEGSHDALDDIMETIGEYRWIRSCTLGEE